MISELLVFLKKTQLKLRSSGIMCPKAICEVCLDVEVLSSVYSCSYFYEI